MNHPSHLSIGEVTGCPRCKQTWESHSSILSPVPMVPAPVEPPPKRRACEGHPVQGFCVQPAQGAVAFERASYLLCLSFLPTRVDYLTTPSHEFLETEHSTWLFRSSSCQSTHSLKFPPYLMLFWMILGTNSNPGPTQVIQLTVQWWGRLRIRGSRAGLGKVQGDCESPEEEPDPA
jgi:hypothetical protein